MLTIVGIIFAGGAWVLSLKTRVVVLETEVVHITKIVPDTAALAQLKQQEADDHADHEQRISRIEQDLDYARHCPPDCDPSYIPEKRKRKP